MYWSWEIINIFLKFVWKREIWNIISNCCMYLNLKERISIGIRNSWRHHDLKEEQFSISLSPFSLLFLSPSPSPSLHPPCTPLGWEEWGVRPKFQIHQSLSPSPKIMPFPILNQHPQPLISSHRHRDGRSRPPAAAAADH